VQRLAKLSALLAAAIGAVVLDACSGPRSPASIIAARCERDGEAASACQCLGERSEELLRPEHLELIVQAANGNLDLADKGAAALDSEQQQGFAAQLARIVAECRAAPPSASG
jgi:hypothetical protein